MIYLDNAATTYPKPEIVYKTMDTFYRTLGANPGRSGHRMAVAAEKEIEDARMVIAQLFGIKDSRRLILTFNATDAINMGIKGLLKSGDHAITTFLEHNAVSRALHGLEKKKYNFCNQGKKILRKDLSIRLISEMPLHPKPD